jgi:hypothetical protein
MGDLRALPNIDETPYVTLGNAFKALQTEIHGSIETRRGYNNAALDGWSGEARKHFVDRFVQGDTDGQEIAGMLQATIDAFVGPSETSFLSTIQRENKRRRLAREWLARLEKYKREHPRNMWNPVNWFTDEDYESKPEVGPRPADIPEPEPKQEADPAPPKRNNPQNPNRNNLMV